jgi:formate dehydrogenase major subunit
MHAKDHHDLGTPAANGEAVTLDIDGATVTVPAGTSIMRAAALAGADIPKLCATDTLKAFGSCRLCLVEIDGRKGFPASCTTEVAAGMKVRTRSDALTGLRRNVLELYISEHPMGSCPGDCELEAHAHEHGIGRSRYAGADTARAVATPKGVDSSNPYFRSSNDLCIVCSRCVRACEEQQGTFALTIAGRGLESRVAASQDEPFLESECVSCGACVEACPTGALMEKSLLISGLPQQAVTTTCAYCGVGCSLVAEITDGAVSRMVPNRAGRANQGHACVKGRFAYGYATHADRVTKPMIRKSITDDWTYVSWDEAFAYAASEFKRIQAKYGKDWSQRATIIPPAWKKTTSSPGSAPVVQPRAS